MKPPRSLFRARPHHTGPTTPGRLPTALPSTPTPKIETVEASAIPRPPIDRDRVARAVREAVKVVRFEDGTALTSGSCLWHAGIGCLLLGWLCHEPDRFLLQAGSLQIQPDPDEVDALFVILAENGGFARGEFHAWIADTAEGQLIDLSSHTFPLMVERSIRHEGDDIALRWRHASFPDFLWFPAAAQPEYVRYGTDRQAVNDVNAVLKEDPETWKKATLNAIAIYKALGRFEQVITIPS